MREPGRAGRAARAAQAASIEVWLREDGRLGSEAPMLRPAETLEGDPERALARLQAGEGRLALLLWADNLEVLRALAMTAAERARQ